MVISMVDDHHQSPTKSARSQNPKPTCRGYEHRRHFRRDLGSRLRMVLAMDHGWVPPLSGSNHAGHFWLSINLHELHRHLEHPHMVTGNPLEHWLCLKSKVGPLAHMSVSSSNVKQVWKWDGRGWKHKGDGGGPVVRRKCRM